MKDDLVDTVETSRLQRLLSYLESDPANLPLLADAAEAAVDAGDADTAAAVLERYAALAPLPPRETNLAGLAAMRQGQYDVAAAFFERLLLGGDDDHALRFNLAWAWAMKKDLHGALSLLEDDVARALPAAAMLRVQILHQHGEFEQAAALAREYVELHPDYAPLMAAVSVLAIDVGDEELAARCAAAAGDHPDALATLGTLALGEERATEALAIFDRVLDANAQAPRAWVGRGLAKLLTGQADTAAGDIDRGAELFGDHLGSWIAAGWAHFVARDLPASRARFETALRIDPNFAESHGSLAVLDLLEGDADSARQRSDVALRLDRQCYSAALAKSMLAAGAGDEAGAQRIYALAINTPVDDSGRTIAQALAKLGMA